MAEQFSHTDLGLPFVPKEPGLRIGVKRSGTNHGSKNSSVINHRMQLLGV
jgi:hypothetical protein